jgi:hypothetical protein
MENARLSTTVEVRDDTALLDRARTKAGTKRALARALGLQPNTVSGWTRRKRISEAGRLKLEKYVGPARAPDDALPVEQPTPVWHNHEWQERHLLEAIRGSLHILERKRALRELWAIFRNLEIMAGWSDGDWQRLYEKRQLRGPK